MGRVSNPGPVRVGHSEREAAVRALGEHFAEGRLDSEEFEERASAAYAARTTDDLAPLFADLPRPVAHPPAPVVPYALTRAPVPPPYELEAPFGREPATGVPYSERNKTVAGILQIVLPFGIGRFYTGHVGLGAAQLLLSFVGIGVLWAWIDGIVILAGHPVDREGRPLHP